MINRVIIEFDDSMVLTLDSSNITCQVRNGQVIQIVSEGVSSLMTKLKEVPDKHSPARTVLLEYNDGS